MHNVYFFLSGYYTFFSYCTVFKMAPRMDALVIREYVTVVFNSAHLSVSVLAWITFFL